MSHPYRILLLWTAYGERAIARATRAITQQRTRPDVWDRCGKLLVIDREDPAPQLPGVPVYRVDARQDGTVNLGRGLNQAFDCAWESQWDFVQILGADCYVLDYPHELPNSGFCAPRLYTGREGELEPPYAEGEGWFGDSCAFLLHSDIYRTCRFCEEMRGYGYEDLDYWYQVLWFAGHRTNQSSTRLMHLWHGPEYSPTLDHPAWDRQEAPDYLRNRRLWMERTARAALETGRADPGFPSYYQAEWVQVREEVETAYQQERAAQRAVEGLREVPEYHDRLSFLPPGLRLTAFRDGKRMGEWSGLGSQAILLHVAHLTADRVQLVLHRRDVTSCDPTWTAVPLTGWGFVYVAPCAEGFAATRLPAHGILVERDGGLGDLVMLLPILTQLHRDGYYVCLACSAPYVELLARQPEIDRVICIEEQPWPDSPRCIDLRWKVDFLGGHPMRETHHRIDCWRELFQRELALEVKLESYRPILHLPEPGPQVTEVLPRPPYAVVHVFPSTADRCYPFMVPVMERLLAAGIPVVAVHSHPVGGLPAGVVDCCGTHSVLELAQIVQRAGVVIGHDSGVIHLAGALDVPFVALFGPIDARLRVSVYNRYRVLRARPDCPPCNERYHCGQMPRPCLSEIPVEQVFAAACELLNT